MESFLSRIKIAIDRFSNGKHTLFAKKAGIPVSTFQGYMKGKLPKPEHLIRISETYKISIDWLLTGEGEMLRGKDTKENPQDKDPEVAELLEGAKKVLKSGNKAAFDALQRNIRYFAHTIKVEECLIKIEQGIEHRMVAMEEQINELKENRDQ